MMITFGYKNKINGPFRALIALALGIMMLVWPEEAAEIAVQVVAVFMLVSALVTFFYAFKSRVRGEAGSTVMIFNTVVNILIAIILFIAAGPISGVILYLIAFVLLFFGLYQIVTLWGALSFLKLGFGRLVLPILIIGFAVALLFTIGTSWVTILAGVALIIYAVSELMSSWIMNKAITEYEIHLTEQYKPAEKNEETDLSNVKDVDFEKVEEDKK